MPAVPAPAVATDATDAPRLLDVAVSRGKLKFEPYILGMYQALAAAGYGIHRPVADDLDLYHQQPGVPVVQQAQPTDLMRCIAELVREHAPMVTNDILFGLDAAQYDSLEEIEGDTWRVQADVAMEAVIKFGLEKIVKKANLTQLPWLELPRHRHTATSATFYYQNGFLTLRRGEAPTFTPLAELPHAIRADALRPRDYTPLDADQLAFGAVLGHVDPERTKVPGWRGRDFVHFLWLITADLPDPEGPPKPNERKLRYLNQLLGYLLHDYRQQGLTDFGVIACDDEAGGSGKGILIQALRRMTTVCEIDAKNQRADFAPGDLGPQTRVKVYNDIPQTWKFEHAYNEITDEQKIRQMHRPEVSVPYADGWKVLITSNWLVRGTKDSDLRRQHILDLTLFFSAKRRPPHFFGQSFFSSEWDATDWAVFDNLLIDAVQHWLDCAFQPDVYVSDDYLQRRIEAEYPDALRRFLDAKPAAWYGTGDLYREFMALDEVKQNRFLRDMSSTTFGRKMMGYLTDVGRHPTKNHNKTMVAICDPPRPAALPPEPEKLPF